MPPDLLRRWFSDQLERWPTAYNRFMRWRFRGREAVSWLVRPDSDLVIEGFPRCANSFALRAFRQAQGPEARLRIASHIHSPAQIALAARWNIPALVLIRPPEDAVVSLLAIARQNKNLPPAAFESPHLERRMRYWTRRYAQFYERVRPFRGQLVLAPFAEVTRDFGAVIDRLNDRFGTAFRRFRHDPATTAAIFRENAVHLSPSPERDAFKERFRTAYKDAANARSRGQAERAFRAFAPETLPQTESR